jgi:hypothetical protein
MPTKRPEIKQVVGACRQNLLTPFGWLALKQNMKISIPA